MCTQKPDWFIAAASNNVDLAKRFQAKFQTQADRRETNQDTETFNGFCAVHYAAYKGHVDMLKFLMPLEHSETTKELVVLDCPGFSTKAKLKVPSGTTCLMIAILRRHTAAVAEIMSFFRENKLLSQKFFGTLNQYNQSAAVFASMCGYPEAVALLQEPELKSELDKVLSGDFVPIFNATAFGKLDVLRALCALQKQPDSAAVINEMMLTRDQKMFSAYELALQPRDAQKFPLSTEETQELIATTLKMMKRAYLTAKLAGTDKLRNKATAFLMGKPIASVFDNDFETEVKNVEESTATLTAEEKTEVIANFFQ